MTNFERLERFGRTAKTIMVRSPDDALRELTVGDLKPGQVITFEDKPGERYIIVDQLCITGNRRERRKSARNKRLTTTK